MTSPNWLGFRRTPIALPARVKAVIAARQREGEILIGWCQLVLVALFGALYAVAPKPTDAALAMMEPVPVVLFAYFAFTVVRLRLAYLGLTPAPLLLMSIGIDIALLMGLIWSFHIQYAQPAAFYLKAPTILYGFIFIALRALRHEPRYVLATGIATAVGWTILLIYALTEDGGAERVTRDYVAYMTGSRILIGGEIDKIVALLAVTGILTLALVRSRRLLAEGIRESTAAADLRRFFPKDVAAAIVDAEESVRAGIAISGTFSVMMIDIRGFTRFAASVPPEEVVLVLTELHARLIPIIRANGGIVDKFMGDGVMATFGAVKASPTYAADALFATEKVLQTVQDWKAALPPGDRRDTLMVNVAVESGPGVFCTLGVDDRLEYTVIGDAANTAAKLEKHAKAERALALTSVATLSAADAQGYKPSWPSEIRRGRMVSGILDPMDLFIIGPIFPANSFVQDGAWLIHNSSS